MYLNVTVMKNLFKIRENQSVQLQPWNSQQMLNVIKKLRVSPKELHDAIIETGSLDLRCVKAHLKKKAHALPFWKFLFPVQQSKLNY
jgi:hypothetical protein